MWKAIATLLAASSVVAQDAGWTPPPPRRVGGTPSAAQPAVEERAPVPPSSFDGLSIGLGAGLALFLFYLFGYEPRRRRRNLVAGLKLIARDDPAVLPEAENRLATALTQGLKGKHLASVRFHLAFVRAMRGKFADASAVLADLEPTQRGRESAYLDLWLQSKLAAHDRVETIYQQNSKGLADLHDAKLILGIALLERARAMWAAKQVGGAADYFKKLRALGVLLDEIPEHIDDHQVVLGVAALFENNAEQAAKHFRGAVEAATAAGKSPMPGRLGLLLCTWTRDEVPDVDTELGALADDLRLATPMTGAVAVASCSHPECGHEFRVAARLAGARMRCTACRRGFRLPEQLTPPPADAGPTKADRLFSDDEQLLINVLLWHAMSLFCQWRQLPAKASLPREERTRLWERLERVRNVNPDLADPDLLEGLVRYYFRAAADETERKQAVALLKGAIEKGAAVPEVIDLVNREERVTEHSRRGLERFFAHVHAYIGDGSVPREYRDDLRERLKRSRRFKPPAAEVGQNEDQNTPSLAELQARSGVLRERVQRVYRQFLQADAQSVEAQALGDRIGELDESTREVLEGAAKLQKVEHELIVQASEPLLREDDTGGKP